MKKTTSLAVLIISLSLFSLPAFGAWRFWKTPPAPLARDGQAVAEIVLPEDAQPPVVYAAEELCTHVEMISGAKLPIVHTPGKAETHIVLAVKPAGFEEDLAAIGTTDGYAVRRDGNTVTILGAIPKGVLTGVYRLITRNTDLIWARPNVEFGTIYTPDPNLSLRETDWLDVPVYILRGWQMIGPGDESNVWQFRQGSNWAAGHTRLAPKSLKYGCVAEYGGGHNLTGMFITGRKYFKDHPEFFPFFKGKRQDPREVRMRTQLCFTNDEMTAAFIREIDERVQKNPAFETYRIMIEDVWQCCECPACTAPIKLADGSEVPFEDPAFRSTQFFIWLNKIADHMTAHYPGKRILTFGYFFTEIPPKVTVNPIISISFCPIGKNSKFNITAPENRKFHRNFLEWMTITSELTWREYFGLCGPFPRPIDVIAIPDWKYVNAFGVTRTYSEMYSDAVGPRMNGIESWNINAPYFWVIANGNWNPKRDSVQKLRREFFTRVYGPAAKDVSKFYSIVEKCFLGSAGASRWNDRSINNWRIVKEAGKLDECRQALDRAAAKGLTGKRAKMLQALRDTFDRQTAALEDLKAVTVGKTDTPPVMPIDFQSPAWAKAENISDFFLLGGGPPIKHRTDARLVYDQENLYVGICAAYPNPDAMEYLRERHDRNEHPTGEGFEIYLSHSKGQQGYYQFVFDPTGNRYTHENAPTSWKVETKVLPDGWCALFSIPWKDLGYKPANLELFRAALVRLSKEPNEPRRYYPIFTTYCHSYNSFCPMKLGK